ncbi:sulfite exporter TauE/SafE family protein [Mesorhizobium sp.]|uniref:HoxN/HupN/NixA family nickel/cobalt transporter n=1 Tax=Mesorhizobium sp. TaxID=1871066 RepID=UPI000FE4955E|nr:sulfite exporter TauE/SafE family protein [Mesorhizobium sp.]RWB32677.1 MAG: ABC transporter permease [Mesorhizobium sp.]RWD36909.1 MAG: ABC transporter permease [Mesorhizobium sp.]RWD48495.1 MAG: ABC transporter permease [Mesorhizobium sp.]RWD86024.1 MAG: ABC transporter permease [Mesorhizobium sp.]RWE54695.1 MAG: ABC transporter permease [Mesorhizobium sp.]
MLQTIIDVQRDIYLAFAGHIKTFAQDGNWGALAAFLPMGIVFGAVHAMTPGHSKSVLATYLAGSSAGLGRSLTVSLALSFTHVAVAVLIALLALPLVSVALGTVGRAPLLEDLSRGLLGAIGLWMVWRALRHAVHAHGDREGVAVGIMAGLIPCPLTLFVMTFAMIRSVPEAGIAFAVTMMAGVALTLSAIALVTAFFRSQLMSLLKSRPRLVAVVTRSAEAVAGTVLVAVALHEIL